MWRMLFFYGRNLRTGIPERIGRPLYLRFIRILRFDLSIIIRTFRYCKCIFRERHIGVVYKVFKFKYFLIKQPGSRERCDFRNALRMEPPCFADRRSDRLRGFFLGLKSNKHGYDGNDDDRHAEFRPDRVDERKDSGGSQPGEPVDGYTVYR